MAGTCGYGEGLSGSVSAGNFLTSCKVYWLASQEGLGVSKVQSVCTIHYGIQYCLQGVRKNNYKSIIRITIDSQNTTSICWFFNLFVRVTTCFGPNYAIIRSQADYIKEGARTL